MEKEMVCCIGLGTESTRRIAFPFPLHHVIFCQHCITLYQPRDYRHVLYVFSIPAIQQARGILASSCFHRTVAGLQQSHLESEIVMFIV
jgi:hypothetical protein